MIREQVTIVLNEREPSKARAAEALQSALRDLGISASRVPVTESIEQVVLERQPLIAVLDYLLGDFSTGLDIVSQFESLSLSERPRVFFLTDEPSVPVAVQAMQHGALDYFEIDHPQSVQKLARAVQKEILSLMTVRANAASCPPNTEPSRIDELVAQSAATASARSQLEVLANAKTPVLILEGATGVGKRAWARAYATLRNSTSLHQTLDLRYCAQTAESLTGLSPRSTGPTLGNDLSLTLLHTEEDDGSLLELLIARGPALWSPQSDSFLVVCTCDPNCATAWTNTLPNARRISIPDLSQRNEDIAPLMQRFCSDAVALSEERLKPFDAAALRWAGTVEWPGNVRQLRAVTIEGSLRAGRAKDQNLIEILEHQRVLWNNEFEHRSTDTPVSRDLSPLTLAQTLELCGHNYRAAAALTGVPTRKFLAQLTDNRREQS